MSEEKSLDDKGTDTFLDEVYKKRISDECMLHKKYGAITEGDDREISSKKSIQSFQNEITKASTIRSV